MREDQVLIKFHKNQFLRAEGLYRGIEDLIA